MNVSISITVKEGIIVWVPPRKEGKGRWRLLPKNGKGTRPVPRRFKAFLKKGFAVGKQ